MEKLTYFVPEHIESLNRLKAHYRVGISNPDRCQLWKEILVCDQDEDVNIDESLEVRENIVLDCQNIKFINQCPAETVAEISQKLPVLLTFYLQQNPDKEYHPRLVHAAFPFLAIGLSLNEAYKAFLCFLKIFLPKFFLEDKKSKADLLRLLVLYHDPTLCSYMDQRGVSPISYVRDWWSVLFFETCTDLTTVLNLWDNIFLAWDPYLYMFISLVLIIRTREQIMSAEKEEIPLLIATTQIGDFTEVSRLIQHALSFSETTPHAFRCQLCAVTQQNPLFFDFLHNHLKTALCLSVGIQDVVSTMKPEKEKEIENEKEKEENATTNSTATTPTKKVLTRTGSSAHITHTRQSSRADDYPKFAQEIYDCRSLQEYNAGRLPSSLHLNPEKLLARLGVAQYSSQHIALLPRASQSGDEQALILRLLQFGVPYVSCVSSGFEACHAMFKEGRIYIESHNEATCLVCTGNPPPSSAAANFISFPNNNEYNGQQQQQQNNNTNNSDKSFSLFNSDKISKMVKDTSASFVSGSKKIAENMNSLLKNEKDELTKSSSSSSSSNIIIDDIDISALDGSDFRSLQEWRMFEGNEIFPSVRLGSDGSHIPCCILVNDRDLIFLDAHPTNAHYVRIYKKYNLSQLSQITYKRKTPKILHFKLEVPSRPHTPPPPSTLSPSPPPSSFSPSLSPSISSSGNSLPPLLAPSLDPTPSLLPSSSSSTTTTPVAITKSNNNNNNINNNNNNNNIENDFQDVNLSASPPATSSILIPPSSPAFYLATKLFFVDEPQAIINAVHLRFEKL